MKSLFLAAPNEGPLKVRIVGLWYGRLKLNIYEPRKEMKKCLILSEWFIFLSCSS